MKKLAIAIGIALVIALTGALWYRVNFPAEPPRPHATASAGQSPSPTRSSSSQPDLAKLERSLNSTSGQTQLDALTPSIREAYKSAGETRVFPKNTTLHVLFSTFESKGDYANVNATIDESGKPAGTFTLILVRNDANSPWLLLEPKQK